MTIAPIGVSTYVRLDLLRETIGALKENKLARESELFVFSDAARIGDEKKVEAVREFLSTVGGFKRVVIVEREENDWLRNNVGSIEDLLGEYGRCIFLEEDVVVAPTFLDFMNQGLSFFEDQQKVSAICAYTPPAGLESYYSRNSFLCRRFSAWGFGIWADRYNEIEMGPISVGQLNWRQSRRLRTAGVDLLKMIDLMEQGAIEALDVRINFSMAKKGQYVVCPLKSLAANHGHDGTGIHCGETDYFDLELDDRLNVDWEFPRIGRHWRLDKNLFFFRGKEVSSRAKTLRYLLSRTLHRT